MIQLQPVRVVALYAVNGTPVRHTNDGLDDLDRFHRHGDGPTQVRFGQCKQCRINDPISRAGRDGTP